jgi:26S proteasome regulatory subunit N6
MILDQVFHGVLNESQGILEVYDEPIEDPMYSTALETLKQMGDVVKGLYEKATQVA